jgi:hydroxymethylpyrimidine/phosphomethylpyrimidine kinase
MSKATKAPIVPGLLSVAGFDPSSGAGISQDLDVFFSCGFHGLAVPTAWVVQGMHGVRDVAPVPEEALGAMLETLREEHGIAGIKIGVVPEAGQARRLGMFLAEPGIKGRVPVVVDPVMAAKNGVRLTSDETLRVLKAEVFPKTTVLTPNLKEAALLAGSRSLAQSEMEACAQSLSEQFGLAVVIKGGHLLGPARDVFVGDGEMSVYERPRLPLEIHGTGCTLSALLCVFLARGYRPKEAFLAAEAEMDELLDELYQPEAAPSAPTETSGYQYLSMSLRQAWMAERQRVLVRLERAGERLCQLNPVELVPAVQMNLAYALPWAEEPQEVAAFPGRIGVYAGRLWFKGGPAFGASSHVARLVLTCMQRYPEIRSCVVLRCTEDLVEAASAAGLRTQAVERATEPPEDKAVEGRSLDYLMGRALDRAAEVPDAIYDWGEVGKEPIFRLLGRDPGEVLAKLGKLIDAQKQGGGEP